MTCRRLVVLALAAAVLLMSGALLDWSGVEYSSGLDRRLAFGAGCLAFISAVLSVVWRPRVLAFEIASGVVGLNMAIVNITDVAEHKYEYVKYPDAVVGVGLYLVLAGGLLGLSVGLVALVRRRLFRS